MRRSIKFISVFLAALMLAMAIPFSAVAKSFVTTEYNTEVLDDENLLLSINNLKDTTNLVPGSDAKVLDDTLYRRSPNADVDETTGEFLAYTNTRAWRDYLKTTNLTLNSDSRYTITYNLTMHENTTEAYWTVFGFCFQGTGKTNEFGVYKSQHSDYPDKLYLSRNATPLPTNALSGTTVVEHTTDLDDGELHEYMISINGPEVVFFIDNEEIQRWSNITYNLDKLSLGFITHGDYTGTSDFNSTDNAFTLCTLTDIKVYDGAYADTKTAYVPFENGETLLKLKTPITSTLGENDYNYKGYDDITVTQAPNNNVFNADGDNLNGIKNGMTGDDTVYAKKNEAFTSGSYRFEGGALTNLPLDTNSKYTVEFYMKKHVEPLNVGFYFDYIDVLNSSNQGVYFYGQSVTTIKGNTSQLYPGYAPGVEAATETLACKNIWTQYQSADGYTRFTIEINGTSVKVFVGGKDVGTFDFGESFNGKTLALVTKCQVTNTAKVELGSKLLSIKDVTVYAGNIESACDVRFEDVSGALLGSAKIDPKGEDNVLDAKELPAVEVPEGSIVKWFYKDTNIIVDTPYTVTHDTTLVARVIDLDEIRVAGVQYTDADGEGKQSIRFISTLHSLEGTEAGFIVKALYKETAEGAVQKHEDWNVQSTMVYTKIKAADPSGSVADVTAAELGGTYLIAIAINGVPAGFAQIDFEVTAYVVVDGETITSETKTITMSNGKINTELSKLEMA